jgi:hypothetical protein
VARNLPAGSIVIVCIGGVLAAALAGALLVALVRVAPAAAGCGVTDPGPVNSIKLGPPGAGRQVGATEYGGPGDPSSGTVGSSGQSLLAHPDSYAELGGDSFRTAAAMGGLAYMTPLRITWRDHSTVAYKRDIGLGGGPVGGLPRVIDLWWQLAGRLGIPYQHGSWSGSVEVERVPGTGAGNLLGQVPASGAGACVEDPAALAVMPGQRAVLLPDGSAAAPAAAPAAVRGIIAAGNQIVDRPYGYGAGHGLPLNEIAQRYDCSSSVEHLLYGGGLLPAGFGGPSRELESFGLPGPGRWVTLYASADHVFMYVAGLRWDTHNAAGPGDGGAGIGWHPLIRDAAGFVARHPEGL